MNNRKNDDISKFIAHRCEQLKSRASMFDRGHIMNDFDLFIAAKTILLCTGKMSESDMKKVSALPAGTSLPLLLSKIEELKHGEFFKALRYVRPLNEYQAAHLESWYTNESKRSYRYKRREEYVNTADNPFPIGGHKDGDELWERIKAKYPELKGIAINETLYPKLKRITIGESLSNELSSTTPRKRRKRNVKSTITIPRPAKGCFYTDEEQWNIIKKYPKGSPERSEAIQLMVQEHYVKSKSTLYRHLKKSEDDERSKMMLQFKPSHITYHKLPSLGLGYLGDYIRPSIRGVVNWKGSIFLSVIPVSFVESEDMDSLDMSQLKYIDICEVIGNSDNVEPCHPGDSSCIQGGHFESTYNPHFAQLCEEKKLLSLQWKESFRPLGEVVPDKRRRITKLYFSPSTFPPPTMTILMNTKWYLVICKST